MDNKQFIVELVQATIWPLIMVFVVRTFAIELKALLGRIQQFNFRTGEVSFNEGVEQTLEDVEPLLLKSNPGDCAGLTERNKEDLSQFEKLASMEPAAAVMIAWKGLERDLRHFYRHASLENRKVGSSISDVIQQLVDADLIDDQFAGVLFELWKLRNIAAHAENHQISSEKALDYARMCLSLGGTLRQQQDE